MPTIAIVDSGIDKSHPCFGGGSRILQRQVLTTLTQSGGVDDSRGHGTFVAGIAACQAPGYSGAAPQAKLVDLDVMDDNGMARTSDVIAAAEWIYQKRAQYNIKVANFSLHSTTPSNFSKDPLDKAVEKLWFAGVTVVVAAGNYGKPDGPSGVPYAPGNDPFVITVGAIDLEGSINVRKHEVPNWSAYGFTKDGFRKPEISAAGRYMIGPVPGNATLKLVKPENVVAPTYMRLSGTSFSSPVVAGAAAQVLAKHPNWTPDMVKGALMAGARFVPEEGLTGAAGVGEVNAYRSAMMSRAPNPNLALNRFVGTDPVTGATCLQRRELVGRSQGQRELERRLLDGRQLERRLLVVGHLVGRLLERRHLERRHLERRAGSGRRHLGGRCGLRGGTSGRHPAGSDARRGGRGPCGSGPRARSRTTSRTPPPVTTRQNKGRATTARPLPHSDGGCRPSCPPLR